MKSKFIQEERYGKNVRDNVLDSSISVGNSFIILRFIIIADINDTLFRILHAIL
jgi:hypothetical protein